MFMSVPWFASWAKILLSSDDISDYRHTPSFLVLRVRGVLTFEALMGTDGPEEDGSGIQASANQLEAQGGPAGTSDKWFRGCTGRQGPGSCSS